APLAIALWVCRAPNLGRRPLLDSLPCSCRVKDRLSFLVDDIRATEFFVRACPLQIGVHDAARMEREGPHALCLATCIKSDREQDVRGLGLAIGREAAIGAALVVRVVKNNGRKAMAPR